MISILVPSRGRPQQFQRMMDSLEATAGNYELLVRLDGDDPTIGQYPYRGIKSTVGLRITMSDMWNELAALASGDLMMLGADDMVMRTIGWDKAVEQEFNKIPDKILMVHGRDGSQGWADDGRFGVFPIVHRKWVETIGYFTPPGYGGDFADTWLNDVADMIGRRKYLPELMQEHLHFAWGKAPIDQTMQEKLDRDKKDNATEKYSSAGEVLKRQKDAEKLRAVML